MMLSLHRIRTAMRHGFTAMLGAVGAVLLRILAAAVASALLKRDGARVALGRLVKSVRDTAIQADEHSGRRRPLHTRVAALERTQSSLVAALFDSGVLHGSAEGGDRELHRTLVAPVVLALLGRGDALTAFSLLSRMREFDTLSIAGLRRLARELRRQGYLDRAITVVRACLELPGCAEEDHRMCALLEGERAVLSGDFVPSTSARKREKPRPGCVLHLVGNSLPEKQSGYTLRTHYTVLAQLAAGLDPHVATQMGVMRGDGDVVTEHLDGIPYHRIPGPSRKSIRFDEWMSLHIERTADLVEVLRPAVLHAASDFVNALTAVVLGEAFGIPVVYETRGFWEETWLSRQAQTFGWTDLDRHRAIHGLPDVYLWRRDLEDGLRRRADRVVTLASVMAERIAAGGVERDRISIVPNAVDVDAFPILTRNGRLAAQLGIGEAATVIGYISSMVEYEGIDTLVAAYAKVKAVSAAPVALLVVGDGLERERILSRAASLGVKDAVFPGMVPHNGVLDYYSLIDIFVVPRKPVEVCQLVTPLKPFEAFATGRTVVLSNVRALAAIAEESGAAEVFEAGDEDSLAAVLLSLVEDPARRRILANKGAEWVRQERTWVANAGSYLNLYADLGVLDPELSNGMAGGEPGESVGVSELV